MKQLYRKVMNELQKEQAQTIRDILCGDGIHPQSFTIRIEPAKSGGMFAKSDDLSGLLCHAQTLDKLLLQTAAAIEGIVDVVLKE